MIGWCKISKGAEYAGVHVKTFRRWLKNGMRYVVSPSGLQMTKYEWIDDYLELCEPVEKNVNAIVDEVMESMA